MVERIRNVIKLDHKKARQAGQEHMHPSSPKRQKKVTPSLIRRYPISSYEVGDCATVEKHSKAISDELSKVKPRDTLLLPLLKTTFGVRRMYVMNEATCVTDVLNKYPALSRTAAVSDILLDIDVKHICASCVHSVQYLEIVYHNYCIVPNIL